MNILIKRVGFAFVNINEDILQTGMALGIQKCHQLCLIKIYIDKEKVSRYELF